MLTNEPSAAYTPHFIISPSGASETCSECGTIYDQHELVGYVPPVGDGCDFCFPPIPEDDDE